MRGLIIFACIILVIIVLFNACARHIGNYGYTANSCTDKICACVFNCVMTVSSIFTELYKKKTVNNTN